MGLLIIVSHAVSVGAQLSFNPIRQNPGALSYFEQSPHTFIFLPSIPHVTELPPGEPCIDLVIFPPLGSNSRLNSRSGRAVNRPFGSRTMYHFSGASMNMPLPSGNEYTAIPSGVLGVVIVPPPVNLTRVSTLSRRTWIASNLQQSTAILLPGCKIRVG